MFNKKTKSENGELNSSELGVLDNADIRRYHPEGEKILEIEKLLDRLIEQDEVLQYLAKRVQSPDEISDRNSKKISQLILSDDVMSDFQAVLVAAHEAHSAIFLDAEKTLRPFLELNTEGAKDLSRVASHQSLLTEGFLEPEDDFILPGFTKDFEHTSGADALKKRFEGLQDAEDVQSQLDTLPMYRFIERNRLAKLANQRIQETTLDLRQQGVQRTKEREEAVSVVDNISQQKLDNIVNHVDGVEILLHVLKISEQAFMFGSPSLQLQAEKTLSVFQRYVVRNSDETKKVALDALHEFETHANFKERRENALDKLKNSSRELKEALLTVEQKVHGISAITRLFDTTGGSKKAQDVSKEVMDLFSQLKEQYLQAQSNYDRARQELQGDEENADTAEALALVDFINSANLKEYFALAFYTTISDISTKLEVLSRELRIPQPTSLHTLSNGGLERRLDFVKINEETEHHQFKDGEKVFEMEGVSLNDWEVHQEGIVIQKGKKLLLNGKELLYKGDFDEWNVHPDGVVIQKGKKFLLNGKELLYKGDFDEWDVHPDGIVIRQGEKFLLNGNYLLYKGDFDDWHVHPDGIIIQQGKKLLLNGMDLLYEGAGVCWHPHPEGGIIVRKGDEWTYHDARQRAKKIEKRATLNLEED